MKESIVKPNKSQQENVRHVSQESSKGGIAQLEDNRQSTIVQRKLQDSMSSSNKNNANPIQRRANKTGLPDNLKSGIENLSGYSMDDVKVHYNSSKPAQLQAHAYAQGSDIHLASGQEKHLPHEAWHVVQQKQGRVKPTRQLKSKVNINDDAGLEKEADVMGAKAIQMKSTENEKKSTDAIQQSSNVVQRLVAYTGDTNDALIANNISYARSKFKDPLVPLEKESNFSKLGSKSQIGIVGHGQPGSINEKTGEEVAEILTTGAKSITQKTKSITLYSCNAALGKSEVHDVPTSLVGSLSRALHKKGYTIPINGMYGICFAFEGIGERTTRGEEENGDAAWFGKRDKLFGSAKYNKIGKIGDTEVNGRGIVKEGAFLSVEEILLKHGYKPSRMSLKKKATAISKILKPFWKNVRREMDVEETLSDPGTGWLRLLVKNETDFDFIERSYQDSKAAKTQELEMT